MCDGEGSSSVVQELDQLGVKVSLADWLPEPWLLLPEFDLALIDRRLEPQQIAAALDELLRSAIDLLCEPV